MGMKRKIYDSTEIIFKNNLKKYRLAGKQDGLKHCETAKSFAAYLDIDYEKYIHYEKDGSTPPLTILLKIAKALHISIDTLLDYDPPQETAVQFMAKMNINYSVEKFRCDHTSTFQILEFDSISGYNFVSSPKKFFLYEENFSDIKEKAQEDVRTLNKFRKTTISNKDSLFALRQFFLMEAAIRLKGETKGPRRDDVQQIVNYFIAVNEEIDKYNKTINSNIVKIFNLIKDSKTIGNNDNEIKEIINLTREIQISRLKGFENQQDYLKKYWRGGK